jgi:hypothetical protein
MNIVEWFRENLEGYNILPLEDEPSKFPTTISTIATENKIYTHVRNTLGRRILSINIYLPP